MHKISLFTLILICLPLLMFAQKQSKTVDIIYLKNKDIVKGKIVKNQYAIINIEVLDSIRNETKVQMIQHLDIDKIEKYKEDGIIESTTKPNSFIINDGNSKLNKQAGETIFHQDLSSDKTSKMRDSNQDVTLLQLGQHLKRKENQQEFKPSTNASTTWIAGGNSGGSDNFDPFSTPAPRRRVREWDRQIRGFRGFLDVGYILGIGKRKNNRYEIANSAGFQFNPIFFLGAGASYQIHHSNKKDIASAIPIFINPRINFIDNGTTPYWDIRTGYSVFDGKGFYFSTAFGLSSSKNDKYSFNFGLSYTLQKANFKHRPDANSDRIKIKDTYHGLGLRLTFEY